MAKQHYHMFRYLLMATDPVHIGAGGYRLGRVDQTIAREPGTNLPKIPGTSLSGAARSYAAMQYQRLRCAGQGQLDKGDDGQDKPNTDHCGEVSCPICYTFGYTKGKEEDAKKSRAGTVNIFDAQILAFPVHSMAGPVWVTTGERLGNAGIDLATDSAIAGATTVALSWEWGKPHLNLGWILLDSEDEKLKVADKLGADWQDAKEWKTISGRLVLTDEKLFSQIVNANLEVRTSVSINPETGAAEQGALFTYEAIPRSTLFYADIVEDNYRSEKFPETIKASQNDQHNTGDDLPKKWDRPRDVVEAGLRLIEWLGVGGMGTRGFGRMRTIGDAWEVTR
jgi:CRISPR-associated protein Cmr4